MDFMNPRPVWALSYHELVSLHAERQALQESQDPLARRRLAEVEQMIGLATNEISRASRESGPRAATNKAQPRLTAPRTLYVSTNNGRTLTPMQQVASSDEPLFMPPKKYWEESK